MGSLIRPGSWPLPLWLALYLVALGIPTRIDALGTAFTYQGQLQHSGTPANDTCDFQFTLFDAPSGGTQVGSTQTLTPVSIVDGLFSVQLDFGGNAFNGADRFLQIAVRCPVGGGSYSTLTPRQPVTAAPYALYSALAGVANDVTCTGCLGSADLANGAVTAAKIADAQVSAAKLSAGGSTSGQVLTSNGSAVVWQSPSTAPSGWSLTGNAGTTASNFLGTTDNAALELRVNGIRALRLEPNATGPNVIGGFGNNAQAAYATIGGGGRTDPNNASTGNRVTDVYGTVGGGGHNLAGDANGDATDAAFATVAGGTSNLAGAKNATVCGGANNNATQPDATVGGGSANTANRPRATVGGGSNNYAHGDSNTVAGGLDNRAIANFFATIGGGADNVAAGDNSTVAGGLFNVGGSVVAEANATVGGGYGNQATAPFATICGGGRTVTDDAGTANRVTDAYATVGGGGDNLAGNENSSYDDARGATVAGGLDNRATQAVATVGGGGSNKADGAVATVGGGGENQASGPWAAIAGGHHNTAGGAYATVPGGDNNTASGTVTLAAGRSAHATNDGSFVWSDGTRDGYSAHPNDFNVTSTGGVEFYYSANGALHCDLKPNGSNWECTSDRNAKENFAPVDTQDALRRVAAMPVTWWNLKGTDPAHKHIGPVAQDFHAAFGLGEETTINTSDAQGVALAAIQGLYQLMQEKDAAIAALHEQNATLEARLEKLEEGFGTRVIGAQVDNAQRPKQR